MIVTELYNGQGFGNQLWSYVITRSLALDRGFDFGIMSPHKFKGQEFMSIDFGQAVVGGSGPEGGPPISLPDGIIHYYVEKDTWYNKYQCDIRDYDPGLLTIPDMTKIEGYFQSEKLILHRKNEIRQWLKVNEAYDCYDFSDENVCILNIRGGEYKAHPSLILDKKYWIDATQNMRRINQNLDFIIITDDVAYTKQLLPEYKSFHFDIGRDYSIIKNAKYIILSNSSFAFFPAWLSETVKYIIAPKYWARHNVSDGFWACAFNLYQGWMWQDKNGALFSYEQCQTEYAAYKITHKLDELGSKPKAKAPSLVEKVIQILRGCKNKIINLFNR